MGGLVEIGKLQNGNLVLLLTDEGREMLEAGRAVGASDEVALSDLLEYDLCNNWRLLYADEIGCLSNAPVLTDGWYEDYHEEGAIEVADGHWWYFEPYQVRSVVTDLLRNGEAIFTSGS